MFDTDIILEHLFFVKSSSGKGAFPFWGKCHCDLLHSAFALLIGKETDLLIAEVSDRRRKHPFVVKFALIETEPLRRQETGRTPGRASSPRIRPQSPR